MLHRFCAADIQYSNLDTEPHSVLQLTGERSESGGRAAQAQRGGRPLAPGGIWPAPELSAPELGAPCPCRGAVTGGHGSNPEPTAHTCTTPEHSAAAESRHKQEAEEGEETRTEAHLNLLNQSKKPPQHFIHSEYLELA